MKKNKLGLALGSGGARGLAHIGVLKVLEREGIRPDYITGSSIGALVGALYSSGLTVEEIEKIAYSVNWKTVISLADVTFGKGAFRGDKLKKFIEEKLKVKSFEDLNIPMKIIATDMDSGDATVFDSGSLSSAIRASISLPMVFTPAKIRGRRYVDGGLSIPVPVLLSKEMGADKVVAVDLDHVFFKGSNIDDNKKFDSMAVKAINLLRYHLAQSNIADADLVISPDVGYLYWNKFASGHKRTIKKGEEAAEKALPEIKKLLES